MQGAHTEWPYQQRKPLDGVVFPLKIIVMKKQLHDRIKLVRIGETVTVPGEV